MFEWLSKIKCKRWEQGKWGQSLSNCLRKGRAWRQTEGRRGGTTSMAATSRVHPSPRPGAARSQRWGSTQPWLTQPRKMFKCMKPTKWRHFWAASCWHVLWWPSTMSWLPPLCQWISIYTVPYHGDHQPRRPLVLGHGSQPLFQAGTAEGMGLSESSAWEQSTASTHDSLSQKTKRFVFTQHHNYVTQIQVQSLIYCTNSRTEHQKRSDVKIICSKGFIIFSPSSWREPESSLLFCNTLPKAAWDMEP